MALRKINTRESKWAREVFSMFSLSNVSGSEYFLVGKDEIYIKLSLTK